MSVVPEAREASTVASHGLYGPGSLTWRVAGEPVMWVAGLRAMYLQALHPRVMRATWQNTAFAQPGEAWGRFLRTVEFVQIRTYGSTGEVERAGRRVRRVHAELTGTDADGSVIRLDDPDLLLWVHCGEIASYVNVAVRCGMDLSAAQVDAFVAEQRRGAQVVGLDPAVVPSSVADLDAYFERMRPQLGLCAEGRQALLSSFHPPVPWPYTALKLAIPPLNLLALASLPRWARRLYGSPGLAVTDLSVTLMLHALHTASVHIPRRLLGVKEPPGAAAR